jgi:cytochrome c
MSSSTKKTTLLLTVCGAAICLWTATSAQTMLPASFTRQQADEGHKSYAMNCASCHRADLSGGNAPALTGETFNTNWGRHTVAELYAYVKGMMPYCDGGSLGNQEYADIIAYILSANGAKAGNQDLTPNSGEKISDIIAPASAK